VFHFLEATGLRSDEFVKARLGDLHPFKKGWAMRVVGKGGEVATLAVPSKAVVALNRYLASKQLPSVERVARDIDYAQFPLLSALDNPRAPITYTRAYVLVTGVVRAAVPLTATSVETFGSDLKASPHWLRHTFGTRAIEAGVSQTVVQRQLRHKNPVSTARYTKAQFEHVQDELEKLGLA
jgi:integrase